MKYSCFNLARSLFTLHPQRFFLTPLFSSTAQLEYLLACLNGFIDGYPRIHKINLTFNHWWTIDLDEIIYLLYF